MAYTSVRRTVANLPKGKLKVPFGYKPKIPDPVPDSALEPSVNQIKSSSENTGSLFFQKSKSIITLKSLE
jgi:hypothetical protein